MEKGNGTKVLKQILVWVLALAIVLTSFTVPSTTAQAATGKVKSITVTNLPAKTLTIKKGKTFTLKTKVTVTGKASKAVTYKSSSTKVATVTSKGKIKAKKNGKTTITITSKANKKKKLKITVTVGTPVTKVALETKSGTVIKGKKVALLSKVSPTKASNKKLIWKSSNKKIATVSSSGVVKGIKAGKATITATAADGSGKKATYKVTVVNSINIKSIKVVNSNSVQVTLSNAYKLATSDFIVYTKQYSQGQYRKSCVVDSISTKNNKTYTLTLNQDYGITENNYVKVKIQKCSASKETTFSEGKFNYIEDDDDDYDIRLVKANVTGSKGECYLDGYGYSSVTVSGLPSGIKYKLVRSTSGNDYVRFYGKTSSLGVKTITIKSTDELGNTHKVIEKWIVYDNTHMYATATPAYGLVGNGSNASISKYVTVKGGSGNYSYQLTGNNYGLSINSSGRITGEIPVAGTYKINVKVTDTDVPSRTATTTVVLNIKQGKAISGIITDSDGNAIPNAYITLTNKNKADKYSAKKYAYADSKGAYSVVVNAGTYDIKATYNDCLKYIYSEKISDTKSGYDIKMPMYKVYISSNNTAIDFSSAYWYDASGEYYGSGNTIYLKNGKYSLTSTYEEGGISYEATLNVTVLNKGVWQTASVKSYNTSIGTGTKTISTTTSSNSDYQYFTFKPSASGTYKFSLAATGSDGYANARVYDKNNDSMIYLYSYGSEDYESESLISGYNYYIKVYAPSGAKLTITKTN